MTEVYINNSFAGTVDNALDFIDMFKSERRKGTVDFNLNIKYEDDRDEIYIETAAGRVRRPLIRVTDGVPLLTENHIKQLQKGEIGWKDLIEQGILEYLDTSEEENAYVAFWEEDVTPEHTHLEITPVVMMGLCASLVPYGNYTQAARLNIGSKNQKQALGFYTANFPVRMDMDVSLLHTPQMPIVRTVMHDLSGYDKHPSGQNVTVAVMSYGGYNIEDALIVNRGSIDRGFGRSTYYRPYIGEELRYSGGLMDEISAPDKEVKGYKSENDYRFLEEDGLCYPEARISEGDVVIGKTSPPRFLSSVNEYDLSVDVRRESSITVRHGEGGTVDFVLLTENQEGNRLIQVRVRDQRIPEIGDKFTSRHGQKGVIGIILPTADMPFTASGIIPDLIFSPHGIPSRMTVSHLLELVAAKTGCLAGRTVDATTFHAEPEKAVRDELLKLGFRENGVETVYNGLTGEQFQAKIYVGSMHYLKLRHMVSNKIHSRARGPIQLLTRQPTEGRAKEGGLRLGEMEKDTFIAHGTSLLLQERFSADKTFIPVCEECGMIAIRDDLKNKTFCPVCGDNVEITDIEISYAFKLIMDELKTLGIYPKLKLKSKY